MEALKREGLERIISKSIILPLNKVQELFMTENYIPNTKKKVMALSDCQIGRALVTMRK